MTLKKIIASASIVLLFASGLMIFSLYRVYSSKSEIDAMQHTRRQSLILSAELEESSRNLTSSVRSFAVTGDERLAAAYMDIVAVRAGKKARPESRAIAPGKTVSLTQLMREAGFTESEFSLLQQANDLSNNLITLETEAMNAVRGLFPDAGGGFTIKGAPDKARAVELVFSQAYDAEVAKIMAPLSSFAKELNQRLDRNVDGAQEEYGNAMTMLVAAGVILLLAFAGFLLMVYALIVRPVLKCDIFAKAVAEGNLSSPLDYRSKNEIGMLASSLRAIPATLKGVIEEYRRLEQELMRGNLGVTGDASAFKGEFADLIKGTNAMVARYQLVFDMINAPIGMFDKNMRLAYMNAFAKRLGGENYLGKSCREVMAREDDGTAACAMRRASETLQTATAETRAYPNGTAIDISYTVVPFTDERGQLASLLELVTDLTDIKKTQSAILNAAAQAQEISNRMAAASEKLFAQVEQVSRGAEVQRERVETTASAMSEMNSTVLEVARNAGQASEQSEGTKYKAEEGAGLVNQVVAAINEVNAVAQNMHANMEILGEQAEAIGSVMNVISDIADQTNLLALNAAIEAARAGDAGRGFAVVADEVRKLAEKTMTATQEVGRNIEGIQSSSRVNIQEMQNAVSGVTNATQLANSSGESLREIVQMASQNSSVVASIATAAEEQSAASEEITHAIAEINTVASETTNGMIQASQAVQELSRMAQELNRVMDALK